MMKLSIAGWIEALLFAGMVLLYISGESGCILVYSIALAAALSIITCVVSRQHFSMSCTGCSGLYNVGDRISVELSLSARGFCFLPFVTVNGRFLGQPFTARCCVLGRSGSVKITLRAAECGLSRLEIDEVVLRDLLGIINLKSDIRPEPVTTAVMPRVVGYAGPEVPVSLIPSDNDEEAAQSLMTGGTPGYDNREYEKGDSLRRINYKLSAKKRALYVRKDENLAAESVDIVIAPGSDGNCAEQAFALAGKLTAAGGTARVICGTDSFTAGYSSLTKLREWLAFRDLSSVGNAAPPRSEAIMHTTVTISPTGFVVT